MREPSVLSIAGSDSGGGAGIQADLKAFAATGTHGATAITCATSQNTQGVTRVDPLPLEAITGQIEACFADLDIQAVKTGMLHTPEVVDTVVDALAGRDVPVVVDPVMVATSGDALASGALPRALDRLAEVTTLVTPNLDEVRRLLDTQVQTLEDARQAGRRLRDDWGNVLVKGGHFETDEAVDLLLTAQGSRALAYPRLPGTFHGAGCTYSSLIAGLLARGYGLEDAVYEARARIHRALERSYSPGEGSSVLDALEMHAPGPSDGAVLSQAAWRIVTRLPGAFVPEVGINMAHLVGDAEEPGEVVGLRRRIMRTPAGPSAPGAVVRGGSRHVARVVLAARHAGQEVSAAMNLAHTEALLDAADALGLRVASFDRSEEPPGVDSTMEWGTASAVKQTDERVDLVVDAGAVGKEAMVRVLAEHPERLVEIVDALAGRVEG